MNKKILICCGNGVGTSLLMKLKAESVFEKHGLSPQLDHSSLGEAESIGSNYDIVLCPLVFREKLTKFEDTTIIIGVQNVLNEQEIEEKLIEAGVLNV